MSPNVQPDLGPTAISDTYTSSVTIYCNCTSNLERSVTFIVTFRQPWSVAEIFPIQNVQNLIIQSILGVYCRRPRVSQVVRAPGQGTEGGAFWQ